ncbi:hypothetical protein HYY73_02720 [Candidatus Woesearchaeota archaeon]|nr:hypothetical protein [Candidatus Woesearchaeota archaeon]
MRKTLATVVLALWGAAVAAGCGNALIATPTAAPYHTPTPSPYHTPTPSERLGIKQTVDGYDVQFHKDEVDGVLSVSKLTNSVSLTVYKGRSSEVPDAAWSSCLPRVEKFQGTPGSPILTREEAPILAGRIDVYLARLYNWVGLQPDCTIKR